MQFSILSSRHVKVLFIAESFRANYDSWPQGQGVRNGPISLGPCGKKYVYTYILFLNSLKPFSKGSTRPDEMVVDGEWRMAQASRWVKCSFVTRTKLGDLLWVFGLQRRNAVWRVWFRLGLRLEERPVKVGLNWHRQSSKLTRDEENGERPRWYQEKWQDRG